MTNTKKLNGRARRQARRAERERAEHLAELKAQRERALKALQVGYELNAIEVIASAADYISRLDAAIALSLDGSYDCWTREHLHV
jgi:hypothetical protein